MTTKSGGLMRQVSAEELNYMSSGMAGSSVLASPPWRLFTKVDSIGPVDNQPGIVGVVRAFGRVDIANPIFGWHFVGRPVLPGVLLQDQLLQLAGVYTVLYCSPGDGVARLSGLGTYRLPVTPDVQVLAFETDIVSVKTKQGMTIIIAKGRVFADGQVAVEVENMKTVVTHLV